MSMNQFVPINDILSPKPINGFLGKDTGIVSQCFLKAPTTCFLVLSHPDLHCPISQLMAKRLLPAIHPRVTVTSEISGHGTREIRGFDPEK